MVFGIVTDETILKPGRTVTFLKTIFGTEYDLL